MSALKHRGGRRRHCGPIQAARRKAYYAAMPAKVEKNRLRKRLKHARDHPNDLQILKLLKPNE